MFDRLLPCGFLLAIGAAAAACMAQPTASGDESRQDEVLDADEDGDDEVTTAKKKKTDASTTTAPAKTAVDAGPPAPSTTRWRAAGGGTTSWVFYGDAQTVDGGSTGPCRATRFEKSVASVDVDADGNVVAATFEASSVEGIVRACTGLTRREPSPHVYELDAPATGGKFTLKAQAANLPQAAATGEISLTDTTATVRFRLTRTDAAKASDKWEQDVIVLLSKETP